MNFKKYTNQKPYQKYSDLQTQTPFFVDNAIAAINPITQFRIALKGNTISLQIAINNQDNPNIFKPVFSLYTSINIYNSHFEILQ